ncbi:hypothetical protein [Streptomyces adelaidensis]|uniref:hypothetical protein n=1 Tax=Streptomyces adelaidensis TaxID=2796465 RepID=UPI001905E9D6|nr:hypothetical protein [Streptomyces adelaidensis]
MTAGMSTPLKPNRPSSTDARVADIASVLTTWCPDLCVATPCGVLAPLLGRLQECHQGFRYVHREDNAVALAVGTALAGGRGAVLMQNSGFGQSVNVLASLVEPFDVPLGLVVSMRGTGVDGTRENRGMGQVTIPVLEHLGLPWRMLAGDDHRSAVTWFETMLADRTRPAVLLVPPESFGWSAAQ